VDFLKEHNHFPRSSLQNSGASRDRSKDDGCFQRFTKRLGETIGHAQFKIVKEIDTIFGKSKRERGCVEQVMPSLRP